MDKPDYSTYTALQLEQVLSRIDKDRFPERAKEVEERLKTLLPEEKIASQDRQMPSFASPLRISSGHSAFVPLPYALLGLAPFLLWYAATGGFLNAQFILTALAALAVCIFLPRYAARFADEVLDCGNMLILIKGDVKIHIQLADIDSIEFHNDENPSITLAVNQATKFGKEVAFFPEPDPGFTHSKNNAIYSDLKARIAMAKGAS